jgi:hypothetical protein
MATMTAQKLWPRFAALIHTAMSTNYSSNTFASDLSEVLDQIKAHCPNLDHEVIERLQILSAVPTTSVEQKDRLFEDLCEAYKVLTEKYIDLLYQDLYVSRKVKVKPEIKYSVELINICVKGDLFRFEYDSILSYSVDKLKVGEAKALKQYCEYILNHESASQKVADQMRISLDSVNKSFESLHKIFPLIILVIFVQFL